MFQKELFYQSSTSTSYEKHLIIEITFRYNRNLYQLVVHTDNSFVFDEKRMKLRILILKNPEDKAEEVMLNNHRVEIFYMLKENVELLKELRENEYFEEKQIEWLLT